jgi:hypothetical protein
MREWKNTLGWLNPSRRPVLWVLAVSFLCALAWAKSQDPLVRVRLSIRLGAGEAVKAVAVLAKPVCPRPVVVFLHDAGTDLEGSGPRLRQLAALGVAAVGLEYSQPDQTLFNRQFIALLQRLEKEPWANTNALAWFGCGRGAQRLLRFVRWHDHPRPQVLICLGGARAGDLLRLPSAAQLGGSANRDGASPGELGAIFEQSGLTNSHVLLVHAREDEVFPVNECEALAAALRNQGAPVKVCILEGQPHNFGENQDTVFRLVSEYAACNLGLSLKPGRVWAGWQSLCWAPLAALLVLLAHGCWQKARPMLAACVPRAASAKALSVLAGCVATVAAGDLALHIVLPRCGISEAVLPLARGWLVLPHWKEDFEWLASDASWGGRPLRQLLEHVELAGLQQKHFYTNLATATYREFILSPRIYQFASEEWGWRRDLWETLYPRIRKEDDPTKAAQTVVRFLRQRVAILGEGRIVQGVETSWKEEAASGAEFQQLYVAALRSVGVAARLHARGTAEFWTGAAWAAAPQPLASQGLEFGK